MSRHTTTATTFGTMRAHTHSDGTRTLESTCKACGRTTVQSLQADENPFLVVKPEHEIGCRFHPDTPRQTPPPPAQRPLRSTPRAVTTTTVGCDPTLRWWLAAILVANILSWFF